MSEVETIKRPQSKPLWFYGNDPARDADYHTISINGLMPRPKTGKWLPMLKDLFRFKKVDYLDVMQFLFDDLFKKMPPTRFFTDATRDPTWAEMISKRLGAHLTGQYKFTTDNKLHLMSLTRQYLVNGYTLPDADELTKAGHIPQDKIEMIRELERESQREQMKPIAGGKISFSDGGKHNDLLHAQALSLKGVYEYQKRSGFTQITDDMLAIGGGDKYHDMTQSEEIKENILNRMQLPVDDMKIRFG